MSENRSCKAYDQKDIDPSLFFNGVPLNCANCKLWCIEIEKCNDETRVVATQAPKEVVAFVRY